MAGADHLTVDLASGAVRQQVRLSGPALLIAMARPDLVPDIEVFMFDALQRAVRRVQLRWPILTGRSLLSWGVIRRGELEYTVVNNARDSRGVYAGYVHNAGTPARPSIASDKSNPGGLLFEIGKALVEVQRRTVALALANPAPEVAQLPLPLPPLPVPSVTGIRSGILSRLRDFIGTQLQQQALAPDVPGAP